MVIPPSHGMFHRDPIALLSGYRDLVLMEGHPEPVPVRPEPAPHLPNSSLTASSRVMSE